ncbi:HER066Wp [Eremothecium sinecaudum]|uniref:HER066Wp n=1 Tax=Eremothecium sinecaudum TaxID=45286 RepID=A0A109UZF2_9SACH|nr:HER066Wp [Eremothecium sinecaudum]AMD21345.1 HER066Wp [Eremothecium sinecaudum]
MNLEFETKNVVTRGTRLPILLQNENGPCALIALANVLLLSPKYASKASNLIRLVQKPTVTLHDLVTSLANIAVQNSTSAYSDTDKLLKLLPQLHTGLPVDPAFDGTFRDTPEMALFRLFNVKLVHGWLVDPDQFPNDYERISPYSYDDAQKTLVLVAEFQEDPQSTQPNKQLLNDAAMLCAFLEESATQLTTYGLQHLKKLMQDDCYAILFRNNHFATIYKHNGVLFTLVTDLGYKYRSDIVWQSLDFVDGYRDEFYTGDLTPAPMEHSNDRNDAMFPSNIDNNGPQNASLEQAKDASFLTDEELARMMQQEEDRRYAKAMQKSYEKSHTSKKHDLKSQSANSNCTKIPKKKT